MSPQLGLRRAILGLTTSLLLAAATLFGLPATARAATITQTYTNPIGGQGQDPSIVVENGFYYYTQSSDGSSGAQITVRRSSSLSTLALSPPAVIWHGGDAGTPAQELWAPELHHFGSSWYLYYSAGVGDAHRMYVAQAYDPMGPYQSLGQIGDATNEWAIDGSVFQAPNGSYYFIWSGYPGGDDHIQTLYIAAMDSPSHVSGPRVAISRPTLAWETKGLAVNEGPYAVIHGNTVTINFSASFCATADYALGQLTATVGADLTAASSWTKKQTPVFSRNDAAGVYGPGHHSIFTSPDGTQSFVAYHAVTTPAGDCGSQRTVRVQPITWNADGTPNFGTPSRLGTAYRLPSGDPGSTAKIIGPNNMCLDVAGTNSTAVGSAVQIWDCPSVTESWTYPGDGTLRTSGRCLAPVDNGTAARTALQLAACDGSAAQTWKLQTNGSVLNTASGRCLDDPGASAVNGTRMELFDCLGNVNQKWQGAGVSTAVGVASGAGVCLDVAGARAAAGTAIQLFTCNSQVQQQWTIASDGSMRALGFCLALSGNATGNSTPVVLAACSGSAAQQWERQPNGALRNAASGRCLDDPGKVVTPGTAVQIYDCNGSTAQTWIWNV